MEEPRKRTHAPTFIEYVVVAALVAVIVLAIVTVLS